MSHNIMLDLEFFVYDEAEHEGLKTAHEIEMFSEALHNHIEIALQDYTSDLGIEDYSPLF